MIDNGKSHEKRNYYTKMFFRIIKLFAILLTTVLLFELSLYILGWGDPIVYLKDELCGYRLAPNQKKSHFGHQIQINSFGMRGPEPERDKKNILFFGDSVTYAGSRIPDNKTFVAIINEKLTDTKFQALNAGVNNYSPINIENWFLLSKNKIEFEYAVLVIPTVDFRRKFNRAPSRVGLHDNFISRSHYFFRVFHTILAEYIKRITAPKRKVERQNVDDFILYRNMAAYRRVIENIQHTIIFFVPSREEIVNKREDMAKKKIVEYLSQDKSGAIIVDLYSDLNEYGSSIFRDRNHYNSKGHEVLSDLMWPLLKQWIASE